MIIVWLFSSKTLFKKIAGCGNIWPKALGLQTWLPLTLCPATSLLPPLRHRTVELPLVGFISILMTSIFVSAFRSYISSGGGGLDGPLSEWTHDGMWAGPFSVWDRGQSDRTRRWLRGFLSALDYFRNLGALFNAFHPWEESGAHRSIAISLILVARHLAPITMVICQTSQFRSWL